MARPTLLWIIRRGDTRPRRVHPSTTKPSWIFILFCVLKTVTKQTGWPTLFITGPVGSHKSARCYSRLSPNVFRRTRIAVFRSSNGRPGFSSKGNLHPELFYYRAHRPWEIHLSRPASRNNRGHFFQGAPGSGPGCYGFGARTGG